MRSLRLKSNCGLRFTIKIDIFFFSMKGFTVALSGLRHVAKICCGDGLATGFTSALTMPKPRPRLHPVTRIEYILSIYGCRTLRKQMVAHSKRSDTTTSKKRKKWKDFFFCRLLSKCMLSNDGEALQRSATTTKCKQFAYVRVFRWFRVVRLNANNSNSSSSFNFDRLSCCQCVVR